MSIKIAILSPKDHLSAETFIRQHINNLPFEKHVIYGGDFPYLSDSHQPSKFESVFFAGINFIVTRFGKKPISFRSYHLKKILKKERIQLVFAEYLVTASNVREVCEDLNLPIIATGLGYDIYHSITLRNYTFKYKELFKYVSQIIVVSEFMIPRLVSMGCELSKITISPIGPNPIFFKTRPDFRSKAIVAIGRFVEKKGPDITIRSFSNALKHVPDLKLVMAGDGPLLEKCQKLVSKLEIDDFVEFKGRINQNQQSKLFSEAFAFIQHSRVAADGDSEGTPVAILEASAAGLPIISTLHSGIPNIVKNNKTGILVEENDIDAMTLAIIKLTKDPILAQKFGSDGKKFVFENFTQEHHIKCISSLIRKFYKK